MDKTTANPVFVALLFVLRCLVPLLVMLGISYLLRRLGLVAESPPEKENGGNNNNRADAEEGGLEHGKA